MRVEWPGRYIVTFLRLPRLSLGITALAIGKLVPPYPCKVRRRDPLSFNVSNFVGPLTKCHIPSIPRNRKVNEG